MAFIERAVFAYNLDDMGFKRDVIGSVLNISKSKLSEMISIPRDVGLDIISAIGAAKEAGLSVRGQSSRSTDNQRRESEDLELVKTEEFKTAKPDGRLNTAINLLSTDTSEKPNPVMPLGIVP